MCQVGNISTTYITLSQKPTLTGGYIAEPDARVVADEGWWSCQPVAGPTRVVTRVAVSNARTGNASVQYFVSDFAVHVEQRRMVHCGQSWTAHVTCNVTSSIATGSITRESLL